MNIYLYWKKPIYKQIGIDYNNGIFEEKFKKSGLASPKNMVYSQINLFPVSLEMIVNNSGLNLVEAEGILLELELDGLIEEVSKNYYIRKHI